MGAECYACSARRSTTGRLRSIPNIRSQMILFVQVGYADSKPPDLLHLERQDAASLRHLAAEEGVGS